MSAFRRTAPGSESVPTRVRRSLRERGVAATAGGVGRAAARLGRRVKGELQARRFDRRLGVETRGVLYHEPTDDARRDARPCQSVRESDFAEVVRRVDVDRERTLFVDVGCGKGKALLLALQAGFRRLLGVELSADLAEIANRNLARVVAARGITAEHRVVAEDATRFEFPPEPAVLFLYHPFGERVLDAVLDNLEGSLREHPRRIVLAYVYPQAAGPLAQRAWLREVHRAPRHVIYETAPAS
jgi:SAM-dependent methyltransferase